MVSQSPGGHSGGCGAGNEQKAKKGPESLLTTLSICSMVCLAKKGVEEVFFGYGCGLFVAVLRCESILWDVFSVVALVNNNVEGVWGLSKVLFADHDVGVALFFEEVG